MLLELKNIVKSYPKRTGIFRKEAVPVLKGVSLFIREGECLGIIGESGSGKSTLSRIILGLETSDGGELLYRNHRERTLFQNEMSVVFQDYATSVNPRFRVKHVMAEPLIRMNIPFQDFKERTISLLRQVGLDESFLGRYPHELSGGQLQRVCIARALATTPRLLVLDEAVSSLDASVQIQVLDLLKQLKKEHGLSYLFMTHDLMTISYICDRVLFFKEGQVVEEVSEMRGLADVRHPYSKKLLLHA